MRSGGRAPLARDGLLNALVLPLFIQHRLTGLVALGYRDAVTCAPEDREQAFLSVLYKHVVQVAKKKPAAQSPRRPAVILSGARSLRGAKNLRSSGENYRDPSLRSG